MAILDKKTNAPVNPAMPVDLMDLSGVVKTFPAGEAETILKDPASGYQIASPSQKSEYHDYVTYTKPTEKVKTFLEAGANTFSAGIIPAIVDKTMESINPEGAKQYQENRAKREEWNYGVGAAGGIAGFVTPGGVASQAEKLAGGIVGKAAATGLGRIAQKTAQGFLAGGGYGLTSEVVPRMIDGHPLTVDAIVDKTWKDALGFAVPHLVLSGAGEALNGINQIKSKTLDYFKKGVDVVGESKGPVSQPITAENLPKSKSAFDKESIVLKANDIPATEISPAKTDYTHVNGNATVKVDSGSITGKGINLDSQPGLEKVGEDLGIEDLAAKKRTLKKPGETPKEFLLRTKLNKIKENWLSSNDFLLTPEEQSVLNNNKNALDNYKLNPDNPKAISDYGKAHSDVEKLYDDVADRNAEKPEIKEAEKSFEKLPKVISDYLGGFDHIRSDGELHVFKPSSINGELTQVIGEDIKPEMKKVISDLGISEKAQVKAGQKATNTASEYAQSLFPKEGELVQGEHLIDHIIDKNEGNLVKSGATVGNVVNAAINRLEASGLNTRMSYADMAKIVDKMADAKYGDPISGNPQAGMTSQYTELKNYAKELRNNGFIEKNKYGDPIHAALDFAQLRNARLNVDHLAFRGDASPVIKEAAIAVRDSIEKHVMETLGQNSPDLQKAYAKAKLDYHTAKTMRTLLAGASEKAVNKLAGGNPSLAGTILAGKIARKMFGPAGEIAAIALRSSRGTGIFNTASEGATQHFSNILTDTVQKYDSLLSKAATGMISEKAGIYPQMPQGVEKKYAEVKKDLKSLENAKLNREPYFNDFTNRNEGSFAAAPNAMNGMMEKTILATDFLLSKAPVNPYRGIPFREDNWQPSQVEIDKYFRYKEAVVNPSVILKQLKDGYATPEAIEVLNTLFPKTKEELASRVMSGMKKEVPQEKKVLLFKVFGIPLDNFSHGQLFAQMQNNASVMIQQEAQQNNMQKPINTSKLSDPMASLSQGNRSLSAQD